MASELPDALEKLALKAEMAESASESSLSKYFGQTSSGDDFFDKLGLQTSQTAGEDAEPRLSLFKSPTSTPQKSNGHSLLATPAKVAPAVSFRKGDEEEEAKIFSYFSKSETNNLSEASDFFDQISQLASKTHEPLEISSIVYEKPVNSDEVIINAESISTGQSQSPLPTCGAASPAASFLVPETAPTQVLNTPQVAPFSTLAAPTPPAPLAAITSPLASTAVSSDPAQTERIWSKAQERASRWWVPSEKVQRWKQSGANLQPSELTCPGLANDPELGDPFKDLFHHLEGEAAAASRQTLTADSVTQTDQGIRELIKAGCWRAAANLCGRLLTAYGQGYGKAGQTSKHSPHSLELWLTRLALLLKCRLTELAFSEANSLGDLDSVDLYYEYYPELQKRKGTMVPFSLRLLVAALPAHHGHFNMAQNRLCRLLSTVRIVLSNVEQLSEADGLNREERDEALVLWTARETRVVFALIDCALMKKDFNNAVKLLLKQLETSSAARKPLLYSILGRIYLQLGDVVHAQEAFNAAASLRNNALTVDAVASLMDAGMVAIAQNAFAEALGYFQKSIELDPGNPVLVNNTAVCLLYTGNMSKAMLLLEENLGTKPDAMIHDDTVVNVCTLYELESSLTAQRKLGMLRLASQWRNDNLNVASFKLQPSA